MQLSPTILSDARGIAAWIVFFCSYFVFALGKFPGLKIDRPGAAIIGTVLMVAFRMMAAQEAPRAIDFSTIVLLFSVTLIVAHLHLGGFFEWVADLTVLRLNARQLLAAVVFPGSVANIIVVERARPDVQVGFREYFRVGLPLTVLTLTWGIIWLSVVR